LFGIPGAAPFALLLGALLIFGIEPGPRILTDHLDTVYVIVWSFAIASVLGAAFCFFLAKPLAKLSFIRFPLLAAAIIPVLFMSGFQDPLELQVFSVMIILGILGWLMKIFNVPRAPFLIGFVLAVPLERYYYLTSNLYELGDWITRPAVLVMIGILVLPLVLALIKRLRHGNPEPVLGEGSISEDIAPKSWNIVMTAGFLALFIVGFVLAQSFSEAGGLFPRLATGFGIVISLLALFVDIRKYRAVKRAHIEPDLRAWHALVRTVISSLLWILGYVVCVYVFGMIVGTALYVPVFLWLVAKARLWTIIIYPIVVLGFMLALQEFAQIVMPIGYLYFGI
jgi:hypothetical protein